MLTRFASIFMKKALLDSARSRIGALLHAIWVTSTCIWLTMQSTNTALPTHRQRNQAMTRKVATKEAWKRFWRSSSIAALTATSFSTRSRISSSKQLHRRNHTFPIFIVAASLMIWTDQGVSKSLVLILWLTKSLSLGWLKSISLLRSRLIHPWTTKQKKLFWVTRSTCLTAQLRHGKD